MKWFKLATPPKAGSHVGGNYGFISKSDGESIFVHGTDVRSEDYPLVEGDIVEFFVIPSPISGQTETAGDVHRISRADSKSPPPLCTGAIKWFRAGGENYGFITKPDGVDVFVHASNVIADQLPLLEGDAVQFRIKGGRDGKPTAYEVRRVSA